MPSFEKGLWQGGKKRTISRMERATGIEPASPAWEAGILPLNYARIIVCHCERSEAISKLGLPDCFATPAQTYVTSRSWRIANLLPGP